MLAWIWVEIMGMLRSDQIWNIYDSVCGIHVGGLGLTTD